MLSFLFMLIICRWVQQGFCQTVLSPSANLTQHRKLNTSLFSLLQSARLMANNTKRFVCFSVHTELLEIAVCFNVPHPKCCSIPSHKSWSFTGSCVPRLLCFCPHCCRSLAGTSPCTSSTKGISHHICCLVEYSSKGLRRVLRRDEFLLNFTAVVAESALEM